MKKHAGLMALTCLSLFCAWLGGQRNAGAEEQEKRVRVEVRTGVAAASAAGNSQAAPTKKRMIAVTVQADGDLGPRVERILKEAGLKGDKLSATRDKILEAVKEGSGTARQFLSQVHAPQVTIVGPDGKPQKIELRRFGTDGETPAQWMEKLRADVEKALEKAGLNETQMEQVRKTLDQVSKMKVPQVTAFNPQRLRVEAKQVGGDNEYMIGLQCALLNETQRSELKLPEGQGLAVVSVFEGTPAEEAGIQAGDVLVKVGGQDVTGVETLVAAVQQAGQDEKKLAVQLLRDGKKRTVQVVPAKRESLEISVQTEIDEDMLEGLKKRLPGVKPEMFFWKQGPGGISGIGPGVITQWRMEQGDETEIEDLKKQIKELTAQVKELQAHLKKLDAEKD
jgi:hypothetical protein